MGTRYTFTCQCGYRATVAGDYDISEEGATSTISCRTCKKLHDVALTPPFASPSPPPRPQLPTACPKGRGHDWRLWVHPGPCPRCGATMRLGEMLQVWD